MSDSAVATAAGAPAAAWPAIRERAQAAIAGLDDPDAQRYAAAVWRRAPRQSLQPHLIHYRLDQQRVLDVGCSFGQALAFFGPDSAGFDFDVAGVGFCRDKLGLDAAVANIYDDSLYEIAPHRTFDALWFSNVLEHLNAPHVALMRLRQTLKDGGRMFLSVPVIPPRPLEWALRGMYAAYQRFRNLPPLAYTSSDHINAFTPATIRFMVERAGFRVERITAALPPQAGLQRLFGPLLMPLQDIVLVIATVDHGWEYNPKACREVDEQRGWRYRTTVGGDLTIQAGTTSEDRS